MAYHYKYDREYLDDIEMARVECERLERELEQAREEYRLAKRLMDKHKWRRKSEWMFYAGAKTRCDELSEEIECLMSELNTAEAVYNVAVFILGG